MARIKTDRKNSAASVLWERSVLHWKLKEPQKRVYQWLVGHEARRAILLCHRRFGKSWFLSLFAIEFALRNPGADIFFVAETAKQVRSVIKPIFAQILRDCPSHLKPRFNTMDGEWTFPNGSRILVAGGDSQIDRLRGRQAHLCILDEAGFQQQLEDLVENVLHPATLLTKGKIIFSSTPPKTLAHAFIKYVEQADEADAIFRFAITENEEFTPEEIEKEAEQCGGWDSFTFRREFLCEIIQDAKLTIIPEWKDEFIQEPERDEFFQYYHRYEGMDLGVRDLTVCLFAYYDFKQAKLVIEDEFAINGPDLVTPLLAEKIREREKFLWGDVKPYRRIADNNNPHLLQDLGTLHQIHFAPTSKESLEAMINEVRIWVQQGRVRVSPKCKQLIGCLKYGVWNERRKEFARSAAYGHFDALAALIYLIRNIDTHTNPINSTHGVSPETHFIPEDETKTQTIDAVRRMLSMSR